MASIDSCLTQDVRQVALKLMERLQTLPETVEMARVTGLTLSDVLYKAQMVRVQVSGLIHLFTTLDLEAFCCHSDLILMQGTVGMPDFFINAHGHRAYSYEVHAGKVGF